MTEKKVYKPECCTGCTFADECFSDIRIKCGEYETAIKEYYRGLSEGLEEGCVKAKELEKVKAELEETLDAQDDKIDFYVSNMNEHILKNKDLEKENAELKEKLNGFENGEVVFIGHYEAVKCYPILKERFAELEAQIEKMKCCGNCSNFNSGNCKFSLKKKGDVTTFVKMHENFFCINYDKWEIAK